MRRWRNPVPLSISQIIQYPFTIMNEQTKDDLEKLENPFEDEEIARQWINSVENEKGMIRDNDIYPKLENWTKTFKPKVILDIGSGQGICADHVQSGEVRYLGVEPSPVLVERAKELYTKENRDFMVGNAYALPIAAGSVDMAFSVNVWFHLDDLDTPSKELSRVLERGGKFLIITANPKTYDLWRSMYFDATEDKKKIDGKVNVPINPMSRNIFYKHTLEEIEAQLTGNGLVISGEEEFGSVFPFRDRPVFICITGHKK